MRYQIPRARGPLSDDLPGRSEYVLKNMRRMVEMYVSPISFITVKIMSIIKTSRKESSGFYTF